MLSPKRALRRVTSDCLPYTRSVVQWVDLRFEGTEGMQEIKNSGPAAISNITISGQSITRGTKKYGLSSWYGGATTQYSTFHVPNFFLTSFGNWKIDFWLKLGEYSASSARSILRLQYKRSNSTKLIHLYREVFSGNKLSMLLPGQSVAYPLNNWNTNSWYNIVFEFNGSNIKGSVDGTIYSTSTDIPDGTETDLTKLITIGPGEQYGVAHPFWIDNFKIIDL